METVNIKEKNKNKFRVFLILFICFVLVPLGIVSLVYRNNKNFQKSTNALLTKFPGALGEHFKKIPTELEKNEKIDYLSSYFLKLDSNVAADKIYIIKKDDEKLYTELIRNMNIVSAAKTEDIVIKIRNMELRKDLLFSIYEEAYEEEEKLFLQEVSRVERQDLLITLKEVERQFSDREFLTVMKELNEDKLVEILYYTDDEIGNYILNTFTSGKRKRLDAKLFEKSNEINNLIELARLYETKSKEASLEAIGNTENYSIDKLGIIYMNLSPNKSAELLTSIQDEKFTDEIFSSIMKEEKLRNSDESVIDDIKKTMEFINEYNLKIKNLVTIYEKMAPKNIAEIVEKMIDNTDVITSIELSSEGAIQLSDRIIILDVLSKMKNQTLSKVLDFMEAEKASQVTRLLARP